jgi:hypothetical protein
MVFISSASLQMSRSLNEYLQNQMSASPSVSIVPSIPGSQPVDGNKSGIRVYLAMKVDGGRSLSDLLDILDGQSVSVLFFFRPSQLSEYDNEIRRLTGSGHLIGLLIEGEGEQTPQEQIARGNLLLEQIILQRTYTLLVDGTDNQRTQLSEQGYLCWLENVDGRTYNRSSITLVTHIMNEVDAKQSFARVILEDSINPTALSKLLRQLATAQYDVHPALETTF